MNLSNVLVSGMNFLQGCIFNLLLLLLRTLQMEKNKGKQAKLYTAEILTLIATYSKV